MKKRFSVLIARFSRFFERAGRTFLYFFVTFTGLFVVMTVIILQVTQVGMYRTTDSDLQMRTNNPFELAILGVNSFGNENKEAFALGETDVPPEQAPNLDENTGPISNRQLRNAGFYVVLFDAEGNILNAEVDLMANLMASQEEKMNDSYIDTFATKTLENQSFRTTITRPKNEITVNGTTVVYIQLFQNVNQIRDSLSTIRMTIIITMLVFWVLSLFFSILFSRISIRPLEVALERQKAFVSNASHELRTPLAIMQNRLQLLFQHPDASILDESENISASLNEVRNMRVLTSNLLNMAKSDGSVKIQPVETSRAFFEEVLENFSILSEEKKKKFTSNIQFSGTADLDQELIKQLLVIFYDNAVKYTDENGEIHLAVHKQRNDLLLCIADNGLGISAKDKKKVFDRFYRVDEARTHGKGGLGLGLSLAKEIVHAMRGKISIEDNQPKGTKIVVKLKL